MKYPILATDFPNRNQTGDANKSLSLQDYCDELIRQIDSWDQEHFVIAAHSIGGVPGLKLAEHYGMRVLGFAAISAIIPKNGGSFLSALPLPQRLFMSTIMQLSGTRPLDKAIAESLCNDLDNSLRERVVNSYVSEARRIYFDKCRVNPPVKPALYIKLTNDKGVPPAFQDMMAANLKAQEVPTIASGHMPMLGQPEVLAAILNQFAAKCSQSQLAAGGV